MSALHHGELLPCYLKVMSYQYFGYLLRTEVLASCETEAGTEDGGLHSLITWRKHEKEKKVNSWSLCSQSHPSALTKALKLQRTKQPVTLWSSEKTKCIEWNADIDKGSGSFPLALHVRGFCTKCRCYGAQWSRLTWIAMFLPIPVRWNHYRLVPGW